MIMCDFRSISSNTHYKNVHLCSWEHVKDYSLSLSLFTLGHIFRIAKVWPIKSILYQSQRALGGVSVSNAPKNPMLLHSDISVFTGQMTDDRAHRYY